MKIFDCLNLAYCCGLITVSDAFTNVRYHSIQMFNYKDIPKEEAELIEDYKKYGFMDNNGHIKDITLEAALVVINNKDNTSLTYKDIQT